MPQWAGRRCYYRDVFTKWEVGQNTFTNSTPISKLYLYSHLILYQKKIKAPNGASTQKDIYN